MTNTPREEEERETSSSVSGNSQAPRNKCHLGVYEMTFLGKSCGSVRIIQGSWCILESGAAKQPDGDPSRCSAEGGEFVCATQ